MYRHGTGDLSEMIRSANNQIFKNHIQADSPGYQKGIL